MKKERYKGYSIIQDVITEEHTSKVSKHLFSENIPIDKYYIVGLGVSCIRKFNSIKSCKKHIDFLIRNNLNRSYTEFKGL